MAINLSGSASFGGVRPGSGRKPYTAPAPVAPPPPTPDPVVAAPNQAFTDQVAANNLTYQTALGQFPGLLGRAGADYGYTFSYDPTGVNAPTVGGIDPSNPNSRAALLQRSYENQQRGNTNSLAARGQLYAGSLQNAQNEAARQYQANATGNQRSFQDLIAGYFNNLQNTGAQTAVANAQAEGAIPAPVAPTTLLYGGVPYIPPTGGNAAVPVGQPTVASVLASRSLVGTGLDANAAVNRPKVRPKGR